MTVTVIIADDDALARTLLEAIIERDEGLDLVGSAQDGPGAIDLAAQHQPDVAVLDWVMPGGGGPHAARGIAASSPQSRIGALAASDSQEAELDMLRAGARSFLVNGCSPEELLRTIHSAARL